MKPTSPKRLSPELCEKFKSLAGAEAALSSFLYHLTAGYKGELLAIFNARQELFAEIRKEFNLSLEANINVDFNTGEVHVNNPGTGTMQ